MATLFSFPNPVNEKASRIVAGVVVLVVLVTVATSSRWLLIALVYGFWARALTGPTLSPLGWAAQQIARRFGRKRPVPGPPKRFAQAVGACISTIALVLAFTVSEPSADVLLLGALLPAAALESIFGYCVGCKVFGLLMRCGVVPEAVCAECSDVSRRLHQAVN